MELKFLIQLKNARMNVNKIIFLFFFSVIFCQTEVVSGFLREVEMSFCMDESGEYYIETFENMYWPVIFNDDMYVFGGAWSSYFNDVWKFNLIGLFV